MKEHDAGSRCVGCAMCCRYVATEIDKPTCRRDVANIIWYVYHNNVSVYIDHSNDWYIEFATSCEQLQHEWMCGTYPTRPWACRELDPSSCENSGGEGSPYKERFETAWQFVEYLQRCRPKFYERLASYPDGAVAGVVAQAGRQTDDVSSTPMLTGA